MLTRRRRFPAGMLFTFLVPETKGKTLEELNGEQTDDGSSGVL